MKNAIKKSWYSLLAKHVPHILWKLAMPFRKSGGTAKRAEVANPVYCTLSGRLFLRVESPAAKWCRESSRCCLYPATVHAGPSAKKQGILRDIQKKKFFEGPRETIRCNHCQRRSHQHTGQTCRCRDEDCCCCSAAVLCSLKLSCDAARINARGSACNA